MKVPTLPDPVKKKGKKSYQTVVEKTDVMEKQKKEKVQEKSSDTNQSAIPPSAMNLKSVNQPGFIPVVGSDLIVGTQSIQAQSNENKRGSQSSLRSFTKEAENQSIVKPKTQSTNEQLQVTNKMATVATMKTEANHAIEERREKASVRRKESTENIRNSRTSLTDAAIRRNIQRQGSEQALPTKSASQTPKKSKFCSLM